MVFERKDTFKSRVEDKKDRDNVSANTNEYSRKMREEKERKIKERIKSEKRRNKQINNIDR